MTVKTKAELKQFQKTTVEVNKNKKRKTKIEYKLLQQWVAHVVISATYVMSLEKNMNYGLSVTFVSCGLRLDICSFKVFLLNVV